MNDEALAKSLEIIKQFESCRLTAYRDPVGVLTVGWGATGPKITSHTVWTQEQADSDLISRVTTCIHQACVASPELVKYPQKIPAIASFIYNLGFGTYTNSTKLKSAIDRVDWPTAAEEIKRFDHAGGQILPGLVRRRNAEAEFLLN